MKRYWLGVAMALALMSGMAAGLYVYFVRDLPGVNSIKDLRLGTGTRVYDSEGQPLGAFSPEKGTYIPVASIPKAMIQAIVAVEDSRFYAHHGVDYLGIARAMWANLWAGKLRQGGSTITQQLAKIAFLTPERSFSRKIREALLARRMERTLSKNQILELYLNKIYFGHGAYGVEQAAKTYFGKSAQALTLAESAVLAGLPKSPNRYSPYSSLDRAKSRQRHVLARMKQEGFLTEEQAEEAYQEPLRFRNLRKVEDVSSYFLEYVRRYLEETYGSGQVYREGLRVYTTLDRSMQAAAARAVQEGLRALDKRQGFRGPIAHRTPKEVAALRKARSAGTAQLVPGEIIKGTVVEIKPEGALVLARGGYGRLVPEGMAWALTGLPSREKKRGPGALLKPGDVIRVRVLPPQEGVRHGGLPPLALEQQPEVEGALVALHPASSAILAMVGGFDFAKSQFNRAVLARRQAGSAFKPIVYATAMTRELTPASIIMDTPVIYEETGAEAELKPGWRPENYDQEYFGPTRLRVALAYSRNVVTIKLLEKTGIHPVVELAQRLGLSGPFPRDLTLALGSAGVTPMELTAAYGAFANGGTWVEPFAIRYITDRSGRILESHTSRSEDVLSPEVAYLITSMLEDTVKYGTGWRARALGRPVAGKTGTTNDYMDAWFVGYAPQLVVGVWVGFDQLRTLGKQETGSRAAAPIWVSVMKEAMRGKSVAYFPIPEGVIFREVDAATGLLASDESEETIQESFIRGTEPTAYATIEDRLALEEATRKAFEEASEDALSPVVPTRTMEDVD